VVGGGERVHTLDHALEPLSPLVLLPGAFPYYGTREANIRSTLAQIHRAIITLVRMLYGRGVPLLYLYTYSW
jgi:hypothetical protein